MPVFAPVIIFHKQSHSCVIELVSSRIYFVTSLTALRLPPGNQERTEF